MKQCIYDMLVFYWLVEQLPKSTSTRIKSTDSMLLHVSHIYYCLLWWVADISRIFLSLFPPSDHPPPFSSKHRADYIYLFFLWIEHLFDPSTMWSQQLRLYIIVRIASNTVVRFRFASRRRYILILIKIQCLRRLTSLDLTLNIEIDSSQLQEKAL